MAKPKNEIEKRLNDFGEEIKALGKKIENAFDKEDCHKQARIKNSNIIWPFITSAFSVFMLMLATWILNFAAAASGVEFLFSLSGFIRTNLGLLFAMALFSGFRSYLHDEYKDAITPFYPIMVALEIVMALWVGTKFLEIANVDIGSSVLTLILGILDWGLWKLFIGMAFFGYLLLFLKLVIHGGKHVVKQTKKVTKRKTSVKRLYRSGNERILGGVCGGIADYTEVDPVIVRLAWVLLALFRGIGILAYFLAWIIIPRNPKHKWN